MNNDLHLRPNFVSDHDRIKMNMLNLRRLVLTAFCATMSGCSESESEISQSILFSDERCQMRDRVVVVYRPILGSTRVYYEFSCRDVDGGAWQTLARHGERGRFNIYLVDNSMTELLYNYCTFTEDDGMEFAPQLDVLRDAGYRVNLSNQNDEYCSAYWTDLCARSGPGAESLYDQCGS